MLKSSVDPADAAVKEARAGILVVDDNVSNLLAIETALEPLREAVVRAQSGNEALRQLLARDFALVLLDVQMPSMDGFETARLIRQRARNQETPIIFVTAHDGDNSDVLQAYAMGAVDFLFKPVVPEILRAKASVLIALQRRTAEVAAQASRLREQERRLHQQELEEKRRQWEQEALRREMEEKSRVAEEMARRAEELKRTVAERRRAEEELTLINQRLEDSDRRKDEFLAVLAHELRNPLAPIVTSLDLFRLLLEKPDDDALAKLQRARVAMRRQVLHLTRLVDDLLDVSRISSGKIELSCKLIELAPLIEQAVATSQHLLDERKHTLTMELSEHPIRLRGDVVRLTQVVANLVNNAARYTPPEGHIHVSSAQKDNTAIVRVRDTGQGIPEHMLESVFDTFVQFQPKGGGLGLGLTLVKRLVELHDGQVSARSFGANQGSEFVITLPAEAATERAAAPKQKASSDSDGSELAVSSLTVVVVEDNEDIRELMSILLTNLGHVVHTASSGSKGLALCKSARPDAALIDIGLDDLDGYAVARGVRAELGQASPYMIAVTGFGQERDRQRAFASGFEAHLIKPATAEAISQILATVSKRSDGIGLPPRSERTSQAG